MRQVSDRLLWLGNAGDLRDVPAVLSPGIRAVVEVADSEPMAPLPRDLVRCRIPLSDGGENPLWLIRLAIDCITTCLRAREPVLVVCSAGLSRSVVIAAAAVALAEERALPEALAIVVGAGPADVSPMLLSQVKAALLTPPEWQFGSND